MQREFLQEKSLNRSNGNAEKSLNIDLSAKSRLIPYSTAANMLSLNDLYVEERDACENYRMIFTVNPICTNILYNAVTEPVFMEGSDDAINLIETPVSRNNTDVFPSGTTNQSGSTVDQIGAIRDTEYSHEKIGNFKYHCGYDIFNNHLLRNIDFEHVQATKNTAGTDSNHTVFNTIFDYSVDYDGNIVERLIGDSKGYVKSDEAKEKIRLYQLDNIKPINTAFYDGLRTVDGWYGFYNSGNINIPNCKIGKQSKEEKIYVNCILNNETRCGFIDLYPDRSLFSFIPKVNRFRRRIERNWDCAIVYPCSSDTAMFNTINGNNANAVQVLSSRVVYDNVGNEQIQMCSLFKHTLTKGSKIRLFYCALGDNNNLTRYSVPVTVISVGNEKGEETNRYFKIKLSDIRTFCKVDDSGKLVIKNSGEPEIKFFYRKIENGCDDKYYFRKFRELKNYQYVQIDSYAGQDLVIATKEPEVVNENSPRHIKLGDDFFELQSKPLSYSQNKIAFGGNIYGDRIAQVIFSDDICVSGLKDNLGRPLTTVYFMAVKTNRGHEEWYEDRVANTDKIEYSHCFGEVTSGLDLPSGMTDYNVRKLHNINKSDLADQSYSDGLDKILENLPENPIPLERDLDIYTGGDSLVPKEFYGDVIEFSRVNYIETTIEKVYHRFNTAQRECLGNSKYFDIHYDELVGDLYDVDAGNQNS